MQCLVTGCKAAVEPGAKIEGMMRGYPEINRISCNKSVETECRGIFGPEGVEIITEVEGVYPAWSVFRRRSGGFGCGSGDTPFCNEEDKQKKRNISGEHFLERLCFTYQHELVAMYGVERLVSFPTDMSKTDIYPENVHGPIYATGSRQCHCYIWRGPDKTDSQAAWMASVAATRLGESAS